MKFFIKESYIGAISIWSCCSDRYLQLKCTIEVIA